MKNRLQWVESYLRDHYEFRFNLVREQIEWRPVDGRVVFKPLGDYELNSLALEVDRALEAEGSAFSSQGRIQQLLYSEFVPRFHPVRSYFKNLPKHKGRQSIKALAASVTVPNPEQFEVMLTKWLVAVAANAMADEGCQNHTCLVLVGPQGVGKTSWLNNLIPGPLKEYLYSGPIVPDSKEAMGLLADSLLINLDDQLRTLNRRNADALKALITQPKVEFRRAYAARSSRYPRLASFMASANVGDFLNDPSGSRRFLTFVVSDILLDAALAINMDAVWGEVWALFQDGFKYWMTTEEIELLREANEVFHEPTFEEELVRRHLIIAHDSHLRLDELVLTLTTRASNQRLNHRALTDALRNLGAQNQVKRLSGSSGKQVRGWNVAFVPCPETASVFSPERL